MSFLSIKKQYNRILHRQGHRNRILLARSLPEITYIDILPNNHNEYGTDDNDNGNSYIGDNNRHYLFKRGYFNSPSPIYYSSEYIDGKSDILDTGWYKPNPIIKINILNMTYGAVSAHNGAYAADGVGGSKLMEM